MKKLSVVLVTAVVLAVCIPGVAQVTTFTANFAEGLLLRDRENAIFWLGTATAAPPNGQQPDACTNLGVTCAEFDLTIDLPHNTWEHSGAFR